MRHLAISLWGITSGAALCQAQSFQFLPPLAPSGSAKAYGISGNGQVVVGEADLTASAGYRAVSWSNGLATNLGLLEGTSSGAFGTNHDGAVSVGFGQLSGGGFYVPVKFSGGTVTQLADPFTATYAYGVSADGSIIVGRGVQQAFRIGPGGYSTLGVLPGFPKSFATGVSANGDIVVGTSATDASELNPGRAFRWQDGVMTALGTIPGFDHRTQGVDISAEGQYFAGWSMNQFSTKRATLWNGLIPTNLGFLPVGQGQVPMSEALDVAAGGGVVVGQSGLATTTSGHIGQPLAFLWTPETGMVNLKSFLETTFAINLTGWTLYEAVAVSDDGTVIAGNAFGPTSQSYPWIAVIPSPSGSLIACCAIAICARRRR